MPPNVALLVGSQGLAGTAAAASWRGRSVTVAGAPLTVLTSRLPVECNGLSLPWCPFFAAIFGRRPCELLPLFRSARCASNVSGSPVNTVAGGNEARLPDTERLRAPVARSRFDSCQDDRKTERPNVRNVSAPEGETVKQVTSKVAAGQEQPREQKLTRGRYTKKESNMIAYMAQTIGHNWVKIGKKINRSSRSVEAHFKGCLEPKRLAYENCDLNGMVIVTNGISVVDSSAADGDAALKTHLAEKAQTLGQKRGPWTLREHKYLMQLVEFFGPNRWNQIAAAFGGRRTKLQCFHRYYYSLRRMGGRYSCHPKYELDNHPSWLPRGNPDWTSYELHLMEKFVNRNRSGRTVEHAALLAAFPDRSIKELNKMSRWVTYDSQWRFWRRRHVWNRQEASVVRQLQLKYGNRWMGFYRARVLPGRRPLFWDAKLAPRLQRLLRGNGDSNLDKKDTAMVSSSVSVPGATSAN